MYMYVLILDMSFTINTLLQQTSIYGRNKRKLTQTPGMLRPQGLNVLLIM